MGPCSSGTFKAKIRRKDVGRHLPVCLHCWGFPFKTHSFITTSLKPKAHMLQKIGKEAEIPWIDPILKAS